MSQKKLPLLPTTVIGSHSMPGWFWTAIEEIEKGGYPHFMLKEINEQAHTITEAIRGRINIDSSHLFQTYSASIKLGGISDWVPQILDASHIYITACGTSWHASLIGSYILEELLNVPVKVEYASASTTSHIY